jgi:hypothetical protein
MTLRDVSVGVRFLHRLPGFLRRPIDVDRARTIIRRRLEQREANFLSLLRQAVYRQPTSPYQQLLAVAGCEYGDVERLVRQEGVEGTLRELFRAGVYLTVDELKGRRPVRRGGVSIAVEQRGLQVRHARPFLHVRSGGSRGESAPAPIDVAYVRERTANTCLAIDARGGAGWAHAVWGVPGSLFLVNLLEFAGFGARPVRWFSQLDPASLSLHPRYRWSTRVVCWASRLSGVALPRPQHVPVDDPGAIVSWMSDVLGRGGIPHLLTYASAGVRVALAAIAAGIDLGGAQFSLTGEPLTPARAAVIRRSGAHPAPWYGSMESSSIGHACVAPEAPDDVHLLDDRLALIMPGRESPGSVPEGVPPHALFLSSLYPTSLFVLLNASLGDQGVVSRRRCGCAMERVGWGTHLHTIRSYEKLTAAGMTVLDSDVIRVLEEVLPARFGGAPTDYQLVEEETGDGHARLSLFIHPRVGPLEPSRVTDAFLAAIGNGSGAERVMSLLWRTAHLPRVERRPPLVTATGKIQHLHLQRPVAG